MRQFKKKQVLTDRRSKVVDIYLRDVNRYPLISVDEEVELAQKIRKGGREGEVAKVKLINSNLRFVVSVANQYVRSGIELSDLIEEGNLGLIKAAELFDETRGFKFASYAVWWIRQTILVAYGEQIKSIKVPSNIRQAIVSFWKENDRMLQQEGRPMTIDEFCELKGIGSKQEKSIKSALMKVTSLDNPLSDDSDKTLHDVVCSDSKTDGVENEFLSSELESAMRSLSRVERKIIVKTFGIGCAELTLSAVADEVGLTRERVRQLRVKAINKLQKAEGIKILKEYL